jgi:Ca-activated chloride channel family protein
MRFADPEILWGLAGIPLLALLLGMAISRRRRAVERLAGAALAVRMVTRVSTHRLVAKAVLLCLGVAFLVLSLARPQWGMSLDPVARRGVDIVLAFDVSASMLAEDVRPSRLARAVGDASRLLDLLDGDRVAVVAFAGSAATLCPLTLDYGAAQLFIDALRPEMLSDQGTSFPLALAEIASVYTDNERRFRAAVIFSDGEDHQGGLEDAAKEAAAAGIIIHTVGVGTPSGAPIPVRRADGSVLGYKEDRDGKVVTSRLQDSALAAIAEETGGSWVTATAGGAEISRVADAVASMEEREMQQKLLTRYEERFQIPMALGLLCLMIDAFIPDRRRRAVARGGAPSRPGAALLAVGMALALAASSSPLRAGSASSLVEEGNRRFEAGEYDEALRLYTEARIEQPDAPEIHLNIGNALFRKGEIEKAREAYRLAWNARDRSLAESARYNSGTAGLSAGQLEQAVEDFREALRMEPTDEEARRNLELALMRLQQQQQQQQQQQGGGKQDGSPQDGDQRGREDQQGEQGQQQEQGDQESPPEGSQGQGDRTGREEAERILDALKGEDRPRIDSGRQRRPERKPEKDW